MTSDPTDWHQILARVRGQLVRGEQRVTTHELLMVHLGVPVTDQAYRSGMSAAAAGHARAGMARATADALGREDLKGLLALSNRGLARGHAGETRGGSGNGGAGNPRT
jgi:hypothetical protein